MIKHFYSYHVEIESVIVEINSLDIKETEKKHLIDLAESHIHHAVLDTVLSELSDEDKKTFLSHLNARDHTRTWKFINSVVENAEEKIVAAAAKVKKELLSDIRELRNK